MSAAACPAWCQLPAGHRFADGAVVHVRMAERMERAGEPLWFVIEAGDGDAVLASVFGETENLTLAEHRATFRSFYGWAVEVGRIEESPAARLPRVALRPPNPRPASEDVYASALAADARTALMARLAGDLGLRRAEIATLHTEDLFQTAGGWWLLVHGKGDRNRALPVGDGLLRQLQALPAGWVFPGRIEGHISPQYAGKLLTRALPDGVTGHALRHRFATKAYAVNRDLFAVQQLLGHASPNTTQAYVKVPEESLRQLVNAIAVR